MAHTIRRKKHQYNYSFVLSVLVRAEDFSRYQRVPIDRHSKEGKKALAEYHADSGFGDYSHACPPRWYRRMHNKRFTAKEKSSLAKWKRNGDYEIPSSFHVRNAGWYW